MAITNFLDIITDVKKSIEAYPSHSFKHVERYEWVDAEGGFPQGLVGGSFSVFVDEVSDDDDLINQDDNMLFLNIQFALDAIHDNYLKALGHCQAAIVRLENISQDNILISKALPYFSCEAADNRLVRVEFEEVKFTINNR
jgi:hypothetical protein